MSLEVAVLVDILGNLGLLVLVPVGREDTSHLAAKVVLVYVKEKLLLANLTITLKKVTE